MTNYLRIAALAATMLPTAFASATEERDPPVVVPVGGATLRVVEIGVAPVSPDPCKATTASAIGCND